MKHKPPTSCRSNWDEVICRQSTTSIILPSKVVTDIANCIEQVGQFTDVVVFHIVSHPTASIILSLAELPTTFSCFTQFEVTFYGLPPSAPLNVSVRAGSLLHLLKLTSRQPVIFTVDSTRLCVFNANSKALLWSSFKLFASPKVCALPVDFFDVRPGTLLINVKELQLMINVVALGEETAELKWDGSLLQLRAADQRGGHVVVTTPCTSPDIPEFEIQIYLKHLFLVGTSITTKQIAFEVKNDQLICTTNTNNIHTEFLLSRVTTADTFRSAGP